MKETFKLKYKRSESQLKQGQKGKRMGKNKDRNCKAKHDELGENLQNKTGND